MARASGGKQTLTVERRQLQLSNLDKVLYPAGRFTKAQVIDYYIRIAPYLLPHLKDRPVTLKRYPEGVTGEHFYEKDAPSFTPEWVQTAAVPRRSGASDINYILINNLPTLVWSANLANLEIHPFLHRATAIDTPTLIAFDLDPGEGADLLTSCEVALLLKDVFDRLKMKSFAKVSGSKGIQVYVPLNTPVTYAITQPFAKAVAEFLEQQHPKLIVSKMAKVARKGKVFIDWSQNADHKTTIGVYSLRAKSNRPYVSMPVAWDELDRALRDRDLDALSFEPEAAIARLDRLGDLFAPVLKLRQKLPEEFVLRLSGTVKTDGSAAPKLQEYELKRNFAKTPEPSTALPRRSSQGSRRRFVIQKHAASHLHYDFRLEMHDVLRSWAVPKGVPYTLDERRLAMATEDHPLEYLDFEGTIPKGEYGGGTVMVWDIGTYELIEGNYFKGLVRIHLAGKKLKGEWTLTRDRSKGDRGWVLAKTDKPMKPITGKRDDASALTGRSMAEIAKAGDRQWHSNRSARGTTAVPKTLAIHVNTLPRASMQFVEPMLAKLTTTLPEGPQWQYEIKWDGYRALAIRDAKLRLLSRRNNLLNTRFVTVAKALEAIEPGNILDGEVVAFDEEARPSFNVLQNYRQGKPLFYYAFDLLAYAGKNVIGLPLRQRRELLRSVVSKAANDLVRFSDTLEATPENLIRAAREQGLEGIIAKRVTSVYEPGKRSGAWVKVKVNKGQELVIGGYRPGKDGFDSVTVGYYRGEKLIFIAKIRNGFTPELKRQVAARFKELETTECPFANLPERAGARRGEALTAAAMKNYRWLKPELVTQVAFTDWTDADHLRHSRFIALRDDVDPKQVTRERSDSARPLRA